MGVSSGLKNTIPSIEGQRHIIVAPAYRAGLASTIEFVCAKAALLVVSMVVEPGTVAVADVIQQVTAKHAEQPIIGRNPEVTFFVAYNAMRVREGAVSLSSGNRVTLPFFNTKKPFS